MIDSRQFNFQFFLGGRTKVNDIKEAAKVYGGATRFDNGTFSNIETDNLIKVSPKENNISLFIPSTINVNKVIDNSIYTKEALAIIKTRYHIDKIKFYNTEGSWYYEDTDSVVIENITILTVEMNNLCDEDIRFFVNLAGLIKREMSQQAVSIQINEALAIV